MSLLLLSAALADTGCPPVEGEWVDGACVQALDCAVQDCRGWDERPLPTSGLQSWRCSSAGAVGFLQINDQVEWVTEHHFDQGGALVGVRHTWLEGGPACCEGIEVGAVAWGDVSGVCVAPVLEPGAQFLAEECVSEEGSAGPSGGCGVLPAGGGALFLPAFLLLWRRRRVVRPVARM
ncbi:MAG: hypothetical protein VX899_17525 [Myxococcota bacterium]|nr:hypothetical protein [Myxococcota bacterium]